MEEERGRASRRVASRRSNPYLKIRGGGRLGGGCTGVQQRSPTRADRLVRVQRSEGGNRRDTEEADIR